MESKKKYSIIIPIYNCANFLERCISSVISQDIESYELILVDDGSTDDSPRICDSFAQNNKNVKVLHKKNEGQSKARNDALKIAKGKYILFIDSDDYLNDGYFNEIEKIISEYQNAELINFGFLSDVDDDKLNNLSSDIISYKEKYYAKPEEVKNELVDLWDSSMLYNIWNKVYLKSIIDDNDIMFHKSDWGEDVEFNKQYLSKINNLYNSKRAFYHYVRERQGATTKKYKDNFFEIRKKEFLDFNEYFEKNGIAKENYYEFSCRRCIERILGCIENVYCSNMKFKERYSEIKKIVSDEITRETLKNAKPKSSKIKIMLFPLKIKSTIMTMLMGRSFNVMKNSFPALFNKLKNRR